MAVGIVGTLGVSSATTGGFPPPPPPPPPPGAFAPTSLTFDSSSYAPGATMTATLEGTPATDGAPPAVTYTDSSGRTWTVGTPTATGATLTATISADAGGGSATLTVNTSPGAGSISSIYTVDAPPPPGGTYPIPYLVAVPSGACGAGFCNVAGVI